MCFKYIKQRLSNFLRNPEQLKADIALIFSNATLYNLPKHKVHKEALRLNEVCTNIINSIWPTLEKNKLKTLDEDAYQQNAKALAQREKKGKKDSNQLEKTKRDEVQASYSLRVDELFEP